MNIRSAQGTGETTVEQSYFEYTVTENGKKKKKKKKKRRAQVAQGDEDSFFSSLPPQMPKFESSHKALLKLQSFKKFGTRGEITEVPTPASKEKIESFSHTEIAAEPNTT